MHGRPHPYRPVGRYPPMPQLAASAASQASALRGTPAAPIGGFRLSDPRGEHARARKALVQDGLDDFGSMGQVVWYPMPASMRAKIYAPYRLEFRVLVVATSALAVLGALLSAYGAGQLVEEAWQIEQYGVDRLSEARRQHLGQRGWAFVAAGYFLTALEAVVSIVYISFSLRVPSLIAAYPEHTLMPHMIRNVGFLVGDVIVFGAALAVSSDYDYSLRPDPHGITDFERSYLRRMTGGQPYALWAGALVRVLTVAVVAALWEGLNVFYWLCLGRCGQEWDSMNGLSPGERGEEERRQEAKVFAVLQAQASAKTAQQLRLHPASINPGREWRESDYDAPDDGGDSGDDATPDDAVDQGMLRAQVVQDITTSRGDLAEVDPWRKILQFYRDPFGCFVYGWRSPNGVRVRPFTLCFATLAHNWWGALRMQLYLGALLLLWSFHLQIHSGVYQPFETKVTRFNNYTWPVYVRAYGVTPLSYQDYMRHDQATYGIRAPPPPAPPPLGPIDHTPSVGHPPPAAHPPEPPPSPPSAPPFPPHPPLEPPLAPFIHAAAGRAFPKLPHDNPRTQQYPPYPPDLTDLNDSSAYMISAARVMLAAEIFRAISYVAYWVGVLRNEASVPGSHLPKKGGCLRMFCP